MSFGVEMTVEKFIYNLVKHNSKLKNIIKICYQLFFSPVSYIKRKRCKNLDFSSKINGFFGFHDRPSLNKSGLIISHIEQFKKNCSQGEAIIEVRNIQNNSLVFKHKTMCCNFQQGSLATWYDEEHIIFNDFINNHPVVRIYNVYSGKLYKEFPFHYFSISPSKKYLTRINFSRFGRGLRGYGYDVNYNEIIMDDTKINISDSQISDLQLITFDSGEIIKSFSINELLGLSKWLLPDGYFYFSHTEFSPDSKSFFFLLRSSNEMTNSSQLFVYFIEEDRVSALNSGGMVSHLCWLDNNTILAYCNNSDRIDAYYKIDVKKNIFDKASDLTVDGHPLSVNEHVFITDTYPDKFRMQTLYIVDSNSFNKKELFKVYSPFKYVNDFRVDLHPRLSVDKCYITIDSSQFGKRNQLVFDLNKLDVKAGETS